MGAKCCDPVPRVNTDVTKCSVTAEQPEARCSALQQLKVRTVTAALQPQTKKQHSQHVASSCVHKIYAFQRSENMILITATHDLDPIIFSIVRVVISDLICHISLAPVTPSPAELFLHRIAMFANTDH